MAKHGHTKAERTGKKQAKEKPDIDFVEERLPEHLEAQLPPPRKLTNYPRG